MLMQRVLETIIQRDHSNKDQLKDSNNQIEIIAWKMMKMRMMKKLEMKIVKNLQQKKMKKIKNRKKMITSMMMKMMRILINTIEGDKEKEKEKDKK